MSGLGGHEAREQLGTDRGTGLGLLVAGLLALEVGANRALPPGGPVLAGGAGQDEVVSADIVHARVDSLTEAELDELQQAKSTADAQGDLRAALGAYMERADPAEDAGRR